MAQSAPRRAFVTGATGMIGSHLVRRLLDEGWGVRALVRPTSDTKLLTSWGVDLVPGAIGDPADAFASHLEGAEVVFHCAALVSDWAPLDEMVRVNVDGTRALAEAVLAAPSVKRMVYLSSMAVFGMAPQIEMDETAPVIRTGDNYNLTKIRAEEILGDLARDRGLSAVMLRPPYVYGPRDRQFIPRLLEGLRSGQFTFLGSGLQPITLCYVRNLVDALLAAGEKPVAGGEVFLITDGEALTRVRLLEVVCQITGYPMPTKRVPVWLPKLLCPFSEGLALVRRTSEPPLINRFRIKFLSTPMTFRLDKARRILGYDPAVDTETGLRETLAWFREHRPDLLPG